jgi:molybdopterin synthase catalytic subunit
MIELTCEPIDTGRVLAAVNHAECGAEVLFVGTTRQWTERKNPGDGLIQRLETSHLFYEAYREMALAQMQQLADEARRRWPIRHVAMVHRLGEVAPTEASVAIAVSCPHRSEAFEAGQWLIDELKHHVPIWKQEHYVQSGPEWIHPTSGDCQCGPQAPLPVSDPHRRPTRATQQSE